MLSMLIVFSMAMYSQASGGQIKRQSEKMSQRSSQKKHVKPTKPSSSNHNVVKISNPDGYINGHGFVDLGLPSGTKWATCNVGTSSPEDYGYYLAWGEIEPRNIFDYKDTPLYGVAIDDICSNDKYDAVKNKWGNGWSIPTKNQWEELIQCCKLKAFKKNGIYGLLFIGKNGKTVFFPAGGIIRGGETNTDFKGAEGHYWTSNADYTYRGEPTYAYASDAYSTECIMGITTSSTNSNPIAFFSPKWRSDRLNIRPVTFE